MLSIQGPKSRDFLSGITHADMSNEAFPYLTMQEIDIGYALVKAIRDDLRGRIGMGALYTHRILDCMCMTLFWRGAKILDLKLIGLQALESHYVSKKPIVITVRRYRQYRYSHWKLVWVIFVKFDKPGGFIGRDALAETKRIWV